MRNYRFVAILLLFTLMVLSEACADNQRKDWTNNGGNWANSGSWIYGIQPDSTDSVYVLQGGDVTVSQSGEVAKNLYIGWNSGTSGVGTVRMEDGTLSVTDEFLGHTYNGYFYQTGGSHYSSNIFTLGYSNADATYNLQNGTLSTNVAFIGSNYNSYNGDGTFTQTGGGHYSNSLKVATAPGNTGIYNLQGGTLDVTDLTLGRGNATFNYSSGTLLVDDFNIDGTDHTVSLVDTSGITRFNVGKHSGTTGVFNVGSGALSLSEVNVCDSGTSGTFNQTGGDVTITDLYLARTSGTGTYALQGGTLDVGTVNFGSGTGNFNFTGGTLSVDTFNGDLTVGANGVLAPGDSPGVTDIYGDFANYGLIQIELGGTTVGTEFDTINVYGGDVDLGGTLDIISWNSFVPSVGDAFEILTWQDGYTFTDQGVVLSGLDGFLVEGSNSMQFVYSDTALDAIKSMMDNFSLDYELTDLNAFYDLYTDADEETVVEFNGETWHYYSGLLPGDDGSRAIGESWSYAGGYFVKLGSGIGTTVPELPPFAGQALLLGCAGLGLWVKRLKGYRVKGARS